MLSRPNPEGLRGKPVDQHACRDTISSAEDDGSQGKCECRYPNLHKAAADKISRQHHDPVSSALDLRPCIVRLQEIVDRQIMYGEEHTHKQDRDDQHHIVKRFAGPARHIEHGGKPRPDDGCREKIHLHDLPKPYPEQLQDTFRPLIEGIGQETVVAVHEQHIGKSCPSVYPIHNKYKIRQIGHHQMIDRALDLRHE